MADSDLVLIEQQGRVATLTLNRPAARNALSSAMMTAIEAAMARLGGDDQVGAIILAAFGPAFCAGHDLKEMRGLSGAEPIGQVFAQCSRMMGGIIACPKPVIAKVHAMATAAGCQLAATCDLAYAADTAKFATPGVNIGLFCSTPMVALSRAVGRKQAMEMLLLGDAVDAVTAEKWGLINAAVPPQDLDGLVQSVAEKAASKSPLTLKIGKEAFYRQADMPLDQAYAYASQVMTQNMLARDAAEGIDAFLGKRPPVWTGC